MCGSLFPFLFKHFIGRLILNSTLCAKLCVKSAIGTCETFHRPNHLTWAVWMGLYLQIEFPLPYWVCLFAYHSPQGATYSPVKTRKYVCLSMRSDDWQLAFPHKYTWTLQNGTNVPDSALNIFTLHSVHFHLNEKVLMIDALASCLRSQSRGSLYSVYIENR